MDFFSDKEGNAPASTDIISNAAWLGIKAAIAVLIRKDSLSYSFPLDCPDGNGICGFDEALFRDTLVSLIPSMDYPFPSIGNEDPFEAEKDTEDRLKREQYAVLDTIEFIYNQLHDAVQEPKRYHTFYRHYDLTFVDGDNAKQAFRESVNEIFRRNGILFNLENDGHIVRVLAPGVVGALASVPVVKEQTVNELLSTAIDKFQNPRFEETRIGLERLWDAFERIKTAYRPDLDKKNSAATLLTDVSAGNAQFRQQLESECKSLTEIGNNFQIRHHEADKAPVDSKGIVDYLFVRMLSMINLLLTVFPK